MKNGEVRFKTLEKIRWCIRNVRKSDNTIKDRNGESVKFNEVENISKFSKF